jgi:hypothetical protein
MEVSRVYLRQDIQLRRKTGMEQPCQLREDIWDRITQTGEPGQDRTVSTGQFRQVGPTGQPGQVSLEKTRD